MKDAVQGDEERVARYKSLLSLCLLPVTSNYLQPAPIGFFLIPECKDSYHYLSGMGGYCSVPQSCLTLCMDCSTPGFPVLHHLPDGAREQ